MQDDPEAIAVRLSPALGGVIISQQKDGTVIKDPRTGEERTVSDQTAVYLGHTVYVTPAVYEAIKAKTESLQNKAGT